MLSIRKHLPLCSARGMIQKCTAKLAYCCRLLCINETLQWRRAERPTDQHVKRQTQRSRSSSRYAIIQIHDMILRRNLLCYTVVGRRNSRLGVPLVETIFPQQGTSKHNQTRTRVSYVITIYTPSTRRTFDHAIKRGGKTHSPLPVSRRVCYGIHKTSIRLRLFTNVVQLLTKVEQVFETTLLPSSC